MLSVPEPATVKPPLRSPPVQFMVPFTVSGPLPLRLPLLKVRLLTVVGELFVTLTFRPNVASSDGPGTWLGDQLAALPQSPPAVLVHARLAADRKSTRLNSSHVALSRMPSSA